MSDRLNLIDTIDQDTKFSTFARMLKTSKAADLIAGAGPFTVFVPTNAAFEKVPSAQMSTWLSQTDQTSLAKVLSYHIVPSKLFASNLEGQGPAATLSGAEVTFTDVKGLKVNGSGIQARNIEATNGMIHALDTVLTPPADAKAASVATPNAASATEPGSAATVTPPTAQADGHSDTPAVNTAPAPAVAPTSSTANAVSATPALAAAPSGKRPTFLL
jgi:Fasciclin domain